MTGKIFIASGWGNSNLPGEIEPVIRGTIGLVPDDVVECGFLLYLLKLVTESPSVIQEKHPWIYGYLLESGLNGTNRSDLAGLFGLHPSFKLTSVDRQTCAELTHTAYNPTWFSQAAPVIDAVNAIAAGLRSFDWNTEQPLPLTLLQYLHKISYQTTGKTVRFDPNGDIYNGYRITVPQANVNDESCVGSPS